MGAGANLEVEFRRRDLELCKEPLGQGLVVVLPGVENDLFQSFVSRRFVHGSELRKVGPGAHNVHQLHDISLQDCTSRWSASRFGVPRARIARNIGLSASRSQTEPPADLARAAVRSRLEATSRFKTPWCAAASGLSLSQDGPTLCADGEADAREVLRAGGSSV